MKPNTIKDLLVVGIVAGVVTILSGDMIKVPEKPKEVERLEEIGEILIKPSYSVSDVANMMPSISSQAEGYYDQLISEREILIEDGALDNQERYKEALGEHNKRFQTRAIAGLTIGVPCAFGLLWYKPKKREDDSEEEHTG